MPNEREEKKKKTQNRKLNEVRLENEETLMTFNWFKFLWEYKADLGDYKFQFLCFDQLYVLDPIKAIFVIELPLG